MITTSLNPYFQVGLDVMDRPCLVIGGGREAQDKGGRLLEAGARLTVVSPDLTPQLESWVSAGRLQHQQRRFKPSDLDGVFLAMNTVRHDEALTLEVFKQAQEKNILINSYDRPACSNFGMAALVNPGHLRLSISTSNASPSLARRLREDLEALFDKEFAEYLDRLAQVRAHLKQHEPEFDQRVALLRSLVADFCIEGQLRYPPDWRIKADEILQSY
jgi:precorrin-2 dehydrogenase/sirohydrochlorin ferrochelatase